MGLETEFYVMDWHYDMINCAVPWDKQFVFSLTNSRCYLFKKTTYIKVKYLLFLGLSKLLCYGVFHISLLWVACYSSRVTVFPYQSPQTTRTVYAGHCGSCVSWVPYFAALSPQSTLLPPTTYPHTPFPCTSHGPASCVFVLLSLSTHVHPSASNAYFLLLYPLIPTHCSKVNSNATFVMTLLSPVASVVGLITGSHLVYNSLSVIFASPGGRSWGVKECKWCHEVSADLTISASPWETWSRLLTGGAPLGQTGPHAYAATLFSHWPRASQSHLFAWWLTWALRTAAVGACQWPHFT